MLQEQNAIAVLDGAQTIEDQDNRDLAIEALYRCNHLRLRAVIEGAGGFIQRQELCLFV